MKPAYLRPILGLSFTYGVDFDSVGKKLGVPFAFHL